MHDTILQSVGHTPLVRLKRLATDVPAPIAVKVESSNPGGSVKDRVGMAMIAEAERHGWLQPGGTIIEATAGNTGTPSGSAASIPTRSARMLSVARLRYACCSVEPSGTTARSSRVK